VPVELTIVPQTVLLVQLELIDVQRASSVLPGERKAVHHESTAVQHASALVPHG
jgi:hypothetical protein